MDVIHEELATILLGPIVLLINQHAGVGVTATRGCGTGIAGVRTLVADPVDVVGEGLDVVVNVGVEVRASLPVKTAALNHVEEMRNNAGFDDALAVFIEVNAPGIAGAFGEQFENVFGGMITPDAGIQACALAVRRAGF